MALAVKSLFSHPSGRLTAAMNLARSAEIPSRRRASAHGFPTDS